MLARLARLLRRSAPAASPRSAVAPPPLPTPKFADDVASIGGSIAEWSDRRRARAAVYGSPTPAAVEAVRRRDPARTHATIAAAERVVRHEFDLLGSGPYTPADPERPARDGYSPIDWYLDPVRNLRFRRGVPHTQWNLLEMRPRNADIKYPWELARCQHWAALGQAFLLTGDDRFALEIARELDDFMEANPIGIGVNWTCTMDVGLRAVSWAIGLETIRGAASLDLAFWPRAYTALYDHGVFIRNNLENTYEVTSNHYLSNLVGLLFLAAVFDDLPEACAWNAFSRSAIEREMEVQVLADGADYESSIPYHRLVAELFLGAARLGDFRSEPFTPGYRARARDMVAYLAAVTRPDGLMPQVGDADDGRLHVFEGYGTTSPQDARHLFGPAAAMFDEPSWRIADGGAGDWEAAWWGYAPSATPRPSRPHEIARLFPQAGTAVARTAAGHYLLATNGIVGTNGFGNHKHNDLLSFEFHYGGEPVIVDPGSYVYTSDAAARNLFRSTAYHNTLSIDGIEQNDLRPDWLFRLFETSRAESVSFSERDGVVEYVGGHHGYERLSEPVTHERTFRFAARDGRLAIVDRLSGRGWHEVRWHFHLAPGVTASRAADGIVALTLPARRLELRTPPGLEIEIQEAWYSPSYGVKVPCVAIAISSPVDLDGAQTWEFSLTP